MISDFRGSLEDPRVGWSSIDPIFFAWHVQNLPSRTSGKKHGRSSTSDSNHWLRKTILLSSKRVRVGKQNRSVERFWFCVQPPALSSFHLSLSPSFSLVLSPTESIGCAHVNGNNSFSRTTIFSKSLTVSLSLSLCVWVRARAFRFPFQQTSINGSCQNVTWLAGMDGGRGREGGVVAFCGHFAEHRYGKVRKARRDNWRMRILKLGFFSLSFFLFFLPFSNERDREQR